MNICIHRGAHQIGGTCIEVESQGSRILLDIGMPLESQDDDEIDLPDVAGIGNEQSPLSGVIISHPHQDHYGLAHRLSTDTTFLIGEAAQRILEAAMVFTPSGNKFKNVTHLSDRIPIILGPFKITPFLMDHSAYFSFNHCGSMQSVLTSRRCQFFKKMSAWCTMRWDD